MIKLGPMYRQAGFIETFKGYKQKYGRYSIRDWHYWRDIRDDTETKNGISPILYDLRSCNKIFIT